MGFRSNRHCICGWKVDIKILYILEEKKLWWFHLCSIYMFSYPLINLNHCFLVVVSPIYFFKYYCFDLWCLLLFSRPLILNSLQDISLPIIHVISWVLNTPTYAPYIPAHYFYVFLCNRGKHGPSLEKPEFPLGRLNLLRSNPSKKGSMKSW